MHDRISPEILIITNRDDHTADYVVLELNKRKIPIFRLNTEDIFSKFKASIEINKDALYISLDNNSEIIDMNSLKSVWYRRPVASPSPNSITDKGIKKFIQRERAEFLDFIYEGINAIWMSSPNSIRFAENKLVQLKKAKELGFRIPKTIITNDSKNSNSFFRENNNICVIKPIYNGHLTINNKQKLIYTREIEGKDLFSHDLTSCPCMFQERINVKRELRVTVIDNFCCAVEIKPSLSEHSSIDWRRWQKDGIKISLFTLPKQISKKCLTLVKNFDLKFSSMDLVIDMNNNYYFLDLNPNGQWAWIDPSVDNVLVNKLCDFLINGIV